MRRSPRAKSKKTMFLLSLGIMGIGALGIGYIFQVNALTAHAFELASLEKNIQEIAEQSKTLETQHSQVFSSLKLGEFAAQLSFEKVGAVKYIQILSPAVARHRSNTEQ